MLFTILSILPYLCLVCTIWAFTLTQSPFGFFKSQSVKVGPQKTKPWFNAIIDGAIVWSLFIWLFSNLASFFHALYPGAFIVLWLIYALVIGRYIYIHRINLSLPQIPKGPLMLGISIICFCALLAALFYPPNMWDVHSYHLPRVMHWLQNHTMAPYPTNIPRQIGMPPFNAIIAMQSLGMGGGDYFVNLGQWLAFIGMIAAVFRITGQLGGNLKAQIFAAFFIATLPNAFIHASNTESSNLVTFWILACASLFLDWLKVKEKYILFKFGICLGFAILSKGSAYVVGLPFGLIIAFYCLRKPRKNFFPGLCAALAIIILNAPHYCRSWQAYGSPFGGAEKNILAEPTPGTFITNAAYNFFLHVPWLLSSPIRPIWQAGAKAMGADENNKDIFPWGGLDQAVSKIDFGDSSTPNFLQGLVILAMLGSIILGKFKPPLLYSTAVASSFALFCLLLTWHPWAARIHTVLFALAAPIVGIYINAWPRKSWQNCLIILFLLWTFVAFQGGLRRISIFDSQEKNILYVSRPHLYFNAYKRHEQIYLDMVNFLAAHNPKSIGLELYDDAFEYPLWALLKTKLKSMPRIFHILSPKDREMLKPEFIVVIGKGKGEHPLALPYVLARHDDNYSRVFPTNKD